MEAVLSQDHTFRKVLFLEIAFQIQMKYHYDSDVVELAQIRKELNHDLGVTFSENIGNMFATGIPPSVFAFLGHKSIIGWNARV